LFAADRQHLHLDSELVCGGLNAFRVRRAVWIRGIRDNGDRVYLRQQFTEQLEPFTSQLAQLLRDTGDVASGAIEAWDKAELDRSRHRRRD